MELFAQFLNLLQALFVVLFDPHEADHFHIEFLDIQDVLKIFTHWALSLEYNDDRLAPFGNIAQVKITDRDFIKIKIDRVLVFIENGGIYTSFNKWDF